MSELTNGWGNSAVATAYIWYRLHGILDVKTHHQMCVEVSELYRELGHNFYIDTGVKIGPFVHPQESNDEREL
jgi:hypothetical protein